MGSGRGFVRSRTAARLSSARGGATGAMLLRALRSAGSRIFSGAFARRVGSAIRFGIIWFTACALVFQATLTFGSAIARANEDTSAALSVICHSIGQQSLDPSAAGDNYGSVSTGHLKCLACVIGHTLAPPAMGPVLVLPLTVVSYAYAQSAPAAAPSEGLSSSHSARGPPHAA